MKAGILYLFHKDRGFGMIAVDGGTEQVFLRHADLSPDLLDKITQGDRLEFDTIQDSKGLRATNVRRVRALEEQVPVTGPDQVQVSKKRKKPKAGSKPAPAKKKRRK